MEELESENDERNLNEVDDNSLPKSKFNLGGNNSDLINLVQKYLNVLGLVFFVWLFGYYNFSVAWILIATFIYLYLERYKLNRQLRIDVINELALNEREAIISRLDEIPSWVYFPDKERAEWVNKLIKQLWPYFRQYMEKLFKTNLEPLIQQSLPQIIGKLTFERIDFGDKPPKISSIKVYNKNNTCIANNEILIDLELIYAGDANFKAKIKNSIYAGIKHIQFQGDLRIILKPLCNEIPLFAAITMYFLKTPVN
jgi:Ca2+-dependent lipid-binding protein